jgi:hypothetical protein
MLLSCRKAGGSGGRSLAEPSRESAASVGERAAKASTSCGVPPKPARCRRMAALLRSQSDAVRVDSIYRIKLRKLAKDAVIFLKYKKLIEGVYG